MNEISNWSDTERPRRSAAARSTAWPWVVAALGAERGDRQPGCLCGEPAVFGDQRRRAARRRWCHAHFRL